jgi:hypothetical protein
MSEFVGNEDGFYIFVDGVNMVINSNRDHKSSWL